MDISRATGARDGPHAGARRLHRGGLRDRLLGEEAQAAMSNLTCSPEERAAASESHAGQVPVEHRCRRVRPRLLSGRGKPSAAAGTRIVFQVRRRRPGHRVRRLDGRSPRSSGKGS
ncbi:MAG: hypothetical protein WKF78_14375 [Candidatus Limnocylindrales bacterium]